jgi:TPR repeat protein
MTAQRSAARLPVSALCLWVLVSSPLAQPEVGAQSGPSRPQAVRECDELAGTKVPDERIGAGRAVPACREAVAIHPDDSRSMFRLARALRKSNAPEAARWYRKAADLGLGDAQHHLGLMYRYGVGVSRDFAEALRWLRKAAEQGHGEAQSDLGMMYRDGEGVPKDAAEAARWYRKAAEQGLAEGQANLGVSYEFGQGVPQDAAEAVRWYRKAADQGLAGAQSATASSTASSGGARSTGESSMPPARGARARTRSSRGSPRPTSAPIGWSWRRTSTTGTGADLPGSSASSSTTP